MSFKKEAFSLSLGCVAQFQWFSLLQYIAFLKDNILPIEASQQLKFISLANATTTNNNLLSVQFSENICIRLANGHTDKMMFLKADILAVTL